MIPSPPSAVPVLVRSAFPLLLALALGAGPALAQPAISEIRIDQTGTDNDEYFELVGAPGASLDGFTYLVIGDGASAAGSGVVEAVVDLTGSAIAGDGFFVAAEGTFTLGVADLVTNLNFENGDNVTHLLVTGFTGADGQDLDTDDDGVLDVQPWSAVTDCVALLQSTVSGERTYCSTAVGPDGSFVPGHVLLCPEGWQIGPFDPAGGVDTPGGPNACGPQIAARLSEIRIDQTGTDNDEYFELEGTPGASLDGATYLVIGDGTGGSGVIEAAVDLDGTTIPASGFFVAAEGTFTLGVADLVTDLNFENGDNVTHLLVSGFTGANGQDLDLDDDGVLDSEPWDQVVDCVALIATPGSGDLTYCATQVGPDGDFVPGHAFLCPAGWQVGAFDPAVGLDTPGAANACGVPSGGDLVINEVDYDQPSTDTAEFLELKNTGDSAVDLAGWTVELINGASGGATVYATIALPAVSLAAGDYFVVCANAATVKNCDLDVSPDTNLIQNGAPDAVALLFGGAVVDALSYEGDVPGFVEGSGAGLVDPANVANVSLSRLPDGADTDQNNVDFSLRCATPGAANTAADTSCPDVGPAQLVINEVDYDQPGSDAAEFIELKNTGLGPVELGGVSLQLINGSGGGAAVYSTIALPAVSLAAGDYFVVCANAATVPHCDLDVTPDTNLIQNGAPDAIALLDGELLIDALSYEGDVAGFVEGSGVGLEDDPNLAFFGLSRFPDGADSDHNDLDFVGSCITPGAPNTSIAVGCLGQGAELEIFEIQGTGAASAYVGQTVSTFENVVTALAANGFFLQTPTARADAVVDTSDGIFVFTGAAPTVAVGDLVDVTGVVDEFFDFTELVALEVHVFAPGLGTLPDPVPLDLATPSPDPAAPSCALEYECYEGMRVTMDGVVSGPSQTFGTDPIAEAFVVAGAQRAFREPGIEYPGLPGLPVWDGNPEVFELDPDRLGLPNRELVAGTTFTATGVLGFEFGGYELWPTELEVVDASIPVAVRERRFGERTIGSLNLFRLFDDVADGTEQVVPTAEYQLRLAKLSAYVREVLDAPDVLAVQEVESLAVLDDLAARIAADDPGVLYTAFLIPGNDVGGIDVGFLARAGVQVDAVAQLGAGEIFSFDGSLLHDRPPLLLEGAFTGGTGDAPIAVMVVHQRSLGGIEDPSDGPRVRLKRLEQAISVAAKVQAFQTAHPATPLVVIGDFNAFEFTDGYVDVLGEIGGYADPAENLLSSGVDMVEPNLVNQVETLAPEQRYSFVFAGSAQTLDHVLTSAAFGDRVNGLAFGRGNADAPAIRLDAPGATRSSDHDGVVLFVQAVPDQDGDGVEDALDACADTAIPESVPQEELLADHWALVDGDGVFDTYGEPLATFTIQQTAGCSCEQIVAELNLGKGQLKFGCTTGTLQRWISGR
ncbi:MAG TPA: lamin tail domain-containing protein [Thermoanaerobaculia bacterium]|nr:lamin tail domain-containing protein [Thermoanaerobaculia bacterium]